MVRFVWPVTWSQHLSHPYGREDSSSIHASQSFKGFRAQLLKMYKRDRHRMILLWIFYEQVWAHAVCLKQKTAPGYQGRICVIMTCVQGFWEVLGKKNNKRKAWERHHDLVNGSRQHRYAAFAVIKTYNSVICHRTNLTLEAAAWFIGCCLGVKFVS